MTLTTTDTLRTLYMWAEQDEVDKATDFLFDTVDDLLLAGDFTCVDALLAEVDLGRLDTPLLVALLAITSVATEHLPSRPDLVDRVRQRLQVRAPERVHLLMRGLE